MTTFRFRLAKVLEWYRKQSQLEGERLRMCMERALQAQLEIERHVRDALARQVELIEAPNPQAHELAALGPFRIWAKQQEAILRQRCDNAAQETERQRAVSQAAQRRLRLIEKLRERQLSEHDYEVSRELEELASESYLARFTRDLNENTAS